MIKELAPSMNSSETTLVLRPVGDRLLYCEYEISLVSGARRSNRSMEISVLVKGDSIKSRPGVELPGERTFDWLFCLCLVELQISPIMNVLPSSNVYEGDILEVVCKVVSTLKNVEVYLTMDKMILKQATYSLSHRFIADMKHSGELVCKAVWGNVQKKTYKIIKVEGKYAAVLVFS